MVKSQWKLPSKINETSETYRRGQSDAYSQSVCSVNEESEIIKDRGYKPEQATEYEKGKGDAHLKNGRFLAAMACYKAVGLLNEPKYARKIADAIAKPDKYYDQPKKQMQEQINSTILDLFDSNSIKKAPKILQKMYNSAKRSSKREEYENSIITVDGYERDGERIIGMSLRNFESAKSRGDKKHMEAAEARIRGAADKWVAGESEYYRKKAVETYKSLGYSEKKIEKILTGLKGKELATYKNRAPKPAADYPAAGEFITKTEESHNAKRKTKKNN